MNNNYGQNIGHEQANAMMQAQGLPPSLVDKAFRTLPGTPTMSQRLAQTQVEGATSNNGLRYAQEVSGQQTYQPSQNYQPFQQQNYGSSNVYTGNGSFAGAISHGNGYGQQNMGGQFVGQQGYAPQQEAGTFSNPHYAILPKVFGQPIVAVRKNGRGNILAFQLANGQVLDYYQMLQANQQGGFEGLRVQANQEGELIIRSVPDSYTENNLDNLPQF